MARISNKKKREPHTADALCEYYSKYASNLEAYACTNTAYKEYADSLSEDECFEFSVWMQRQRALGDKNKEYVRRLIEIGLKRGADISYAPQEPNQGPFEEYLWLTANYTLKNWSRCRQSYRFSLPMISALRQTSQNEFLANVFETLPYRSFYLDLTGAGEYISDGINQSRREQIKGCFVHIDKIEAHGNYVDTWFVYQVYVAEGYSIYAMKNVYYSNEKARPSDGAIQASERNGEDETPPPSNTSEPVINMIAYIAASNADIARKPSIQNPFPNAGAGQAKKPPVVNWDVGFRIGPSIEKALHRAKEANASCSGNGRGTNHSSPRPHIRAAHWHHYWTGTKENRVLSLRWVSQVFVNCVDAENLPVVEHRNSEGKERGDDEDDQS